MQIPRHILRDRRFWAGLFGLGLVLGVAGPFGTVTSLPLPRRIGYWMLMVFLTGPSGLICTRFFAAALRRLAVPDLAATLLAGGLAGLPINLIVHGANAILLSPGDVALAPLTLSASLVAICVAISAAVALAFPPGAGPPPALSPPIPASPGTPPAPAPLPPPTPDSTPDCRLLDRLPAALRSPLVALDATDHYTRVTTTQGSALVLLRLSDAIAESAPTPGLRIHRSHWVALHAVTSARREALRGFVTSADGTERPVSRSHLAVVEEAGLLPRR